MGMKRLLLLLILFTATVGQAAVGDPARYWPNGSTLNVRFIDGDPEFYKTVERYANEWTQYGNIRFRFFSKPKEGRIDHIRITFYGASNSSEVGTDSIDVKAQNEHSMKLPVFTRGGKTQERIRRVVLHEFGHALGLKHEHQSPAFPFVRDESVIEKCVEVKLEKNADQEEQEALETCALRYEPLTKTLFEFTEFDSRSIMMYKIRAGSLKGFPRLGFDKSSELSLIDKDFMGGVYPY